MLVGCKPEITLVHLCNFAQTSHQHILRCILYASILDEERKSPVPVGLLMPAISIDVRCERELLGFLKLVSQSLFDLFAEPRHAVIFDRVLQTRMFSIHSVAMISLNEHNFLTNFYRLVHGAKTQWLCKHWISFGVSVSLTHSSTNGDIEAKQFTISGDGDVPKIMCQDIDVIFRWDRNSNFKFAGKIRFTVLVSVKSTNGSSFP
jgi:hypothetical protein